MIKNLIKNLEEMTRKNKETKEQLDQDIKMLDDFNEALLQRNAEILKSL